MLTRRPSPTARPGQRNRRAPTAPPTSGRSRSGPGTAGPAALEVATADPTASRDTPAAHPPSAPEEREATPIGPEAARPPGTSVTTTRFRPQYRGFHNPTDICTAMLAALPPDNLTRPPPRGSAGGLESRHRPGGCPEPAEPRRALRRPRLRPHPTPHATPGRSPHQAVRSRVRSETG